MPAHHDCATVHWQGDPSLLGKSLYVLPLLLSVEQDFPLACPHPLSGDGSSNTCDVCKEGYYLNEPNATSVEILRDPSKYCKSCPSNANCSTPNVTLESLGVPTGFWRASPRTAMLYSCDDSDTCAGSVDLSSRLALLEDGASDAIFCSDGHKGPLCQVCVDHGQYFSRDDGHCIDCPSTERAAAILVLLACLAAVFALGYCAATCIAATRAWICQLAQLESEVGFQPKVKILLGSTRLAAP